MFSLAHTLQIWRLRTECKLFNCTLAIKMNIISNVLLRSSNGVHETRYDY